MCTYTAIHSEQSWKNMYMLQYRNTDISPCIYYSAQIWTLRSDHMYTIYAQQYMYLHRRVRQRNDCQHLRELLLLGYEFLLPLLIHMTKANFCLWVVWVQEIGLYWKAKERDERRTLRIHPGSAHRNANLIPQSFTLLRRFPYSSV
jgi:hypothetical protein